MTSFNSTVAVITSISADRLSSIETLEFSDQSISAGGVGEFPALRYIAGYDDLITAFGTDGAAAFAHYVYHGRNEGRSPTLFEPLQYIASYSDLIVAFGLNQLVATQHFILHGRGEGRSRDDFNAEQYLANYADLQAAFGTDTNAATSHFIANGYSEGRTDDPLP